MRNLKAVAIAVGVIAAASAVAVSIGMSRYDDPEEPAPVTTSAEAVKVTKPPSLADKTVADGDMPKKVSVKTPMLILGAGEEYPLQGLYNGSKPASGAVYSSDNEGVVHADSASGQLTAQAPGYATVTVQSPNGLTAKCYVTVKNAPSAVRFPSGTATMQKDEQQQLTLLSASDGEGFAGASFASSDPNIAEVSADGAITAKGAGEATISAAAFNGARAEMKLTVLDNTGFTERETVAKATMRTDAGWNFPAIETIPENTAVSCYGTSDDGRWIKVKYNKRFGYIYNKAFDEVSNTSEFTLEVLPVLADDLIFDIGTDKRAIFDFVYNISYVNSEDDTTENLCLDYFKTLKGSCYHHAAMLCYLYNRCGYETLRLNGISSADHESEHSWCLSKTDEGWRHVDAQLFTIRTADEQYFITDDQYVWFDWDRSAYPAAV